MEYILNTAIKQEYTSYVQILVVNDINYSLSTKSLKILYVIIKVVKNKHS